MASGSGPSLSKSSPLPRSVPQTVSPSGTTRSIQVSRLWSPRGRCLSSLCPLSLSFSLSLSLSFSTPVSFTLCPRLCSMRPITPTGNQMNMYNIFVPRNALFALRISSSAASCHLGQTFSHRRNKWGVLLHARVEL